MSTKASNRHEHEGLGIAYQRVGTGSAIVLLHNGGTSHAIWRDVVPRLADAGHEVFALDLAGFGAVREWMMRLQLGRRGRARPIDRADELCACYDAPGQVRSLVGVLDDLAAYGELDRFIPPAAGFPPITTIWGLDNLVLSPAAGRRLGQTLRPVREEWLEGCGHLLMLEAPERVASAILSATTAHVEAA